MKDRLILTFPPRNAQGILLRLDTPIIIHTLQLVGGDNDLDVVGYHLVIM